MGEERYCGVPVRQVLRAKRLKDECPELAHEVWQGTMTLWAAEQELKARKRWKKLYGDKDA